MNIQIAINPESKSRAEHDLFHMACKLDDNWYVWMNRKLGFETDDDGSVNREVDCILYHREHGMLVIECKSNRISAEYDEKKKATVWKRAGEVITGRDPVDQVSSLIGPLHDYLKQVVKRPGSQRTYPLRVQWAVCFSDMDSMEGLPSLVLSRRRTLLRPDLLDVKKFENRLIDILQTKEASRNNKPFPNERLDDEALFSLLNFLDGSGMRYSESEMFKEADDVFQVKPTDIQRMLMDSISRNRRMKIEGVAGSGKSRMVEWEALHLSKMGKNVAIVCYNDLLADELKNSMKETLEKDRSVVAETYKEDGGFSYGRIDVHAYSEWCKTYVKAAKLDVTNKGDASEYYDHLLPAAFCKAQKILAKDKKKREQYFYDAVIIDEGQDLSSDWVDSIIALLKNDERGIVRFFYDPAQRLYGKRNGIENAQIAAMPVLVLNRTYRNTKSILKWVFKNTGFRLEPYNNAAAGNSVKEKYYTDPAEQVDLLLASYKELIAKNKLSPEDVLVVSMRSQGSSALKDLKDDRFIWNGVGNKRIVKDKVNIVSAHRIKGLDAAAVILIDVEEPKDPAKREDWKRRLLVGATRARKLLTVIRKK